MVAVGVAGKVKAGRACPARVYKTCSRHVKGGTVQTVTQSCRIDRQERSSRYSLPSRRRSNSDISGRSSQQLGLLERVTSRPSLFYRNDGRGNIQYGWTGRWSASSWQIRDYGHIWQQSEILVPSVALMFSVMQWKSLKSVRPEFGAELLDIKQVPWGHLLNVYSLSSLYFCPCSCRPTSHQSC